MTSKLPPNRKSSPTQTKARAQRVPTRQATAQRLQRQLGNRGTHQFLQALAGREASVQRQEIENDEELQRKLGATQGQSLEELEEEEVVQGQFTTGKAPAHRRQGGAEENLSGLPGQLRAGLEQLSGMDLSKIRVHRSSGSPAQLNALAYTQGRDIHLGPGQEKHLPHEGWHAVQQIQGRVKPTIQVKGVSINDDADLEREAEVMGAKALQATRVRRPKHSQPAPVSRPAAPATDSIRPAIQRAMKFELQSKNRIWRNDGVNPPKLLGRKYGPSDFLVKGATGVRLESETGGVLEFETDWLRKWSKLEEQLEEAIAMTTKMNDAPDAKGGRKVFPFNVGHLKKGSRAELRKGVWSPRKGMENKNEKILGKSEKLEVEVRDKTWAAGIQSSESFLLSQYESFLQQHEFPEFKTSVIASAQDMLDAANTERLPAKELVNLRNFLQIIINYIKRGQGKPGGGGKQEFWKGAYANVKGMPAKQAFVLMSRTSFSSMFKSLLSKDEKRLFKKIVRDDKKGILPNLGLDRKTPFFIEGYGTEKHYPGPTVYEWLAGIYQGYDLLSGRMGRGLSGAMGKFELTEERKKNKGLVRFEARFSRYMGKGVWRAAKDWVEYAKALFDYAAVKRPREAGKGGTGLKRD